MAMHNYIRMHALEDKEFDKCYADPDYIPEIEEDEIVIQVSNNSVNAGQEIDDGSMDDSSMESVRDEIATSLLSHMKY
ncbi:unnamed protein product [Amaranthus hypochondriacus]